MKHMVTPRVLRPADFIIFLVIFVTDNAKHAHFLTSIYAVVGIIIGIIIILCKREKQVTLVVFLLFEAITGRIIIITGWLNADSL